VRLQRKALERHPADKELSRLLVASDLAMSYSCGSGHRSLLIFHFSSPTSQFLALKSVIAHVAAYQFPDVALQDSLHTSHTYIIRKNNMYPKNMWLSLTTRPLYSQASFYNFHYTNPVSKLFNLLH
jgi:hypothetical protein